MKKRIQFTSKNLTGLNRDIVSDESNPLFEDLKNLSPNKKVGGLSIWKSLISNSDYNILPKDYDDTRLFKYNSKDYDDCILQFYNLSGGKVDVVPSNGAKINFSLEDEIDNFDELFCVQVDTRLIIIDNKANKSYLLRHDEDESYCTKTLSLIPDETTLENPPNTNLRITIKEQGKHGYLDHDRLSSNNTNVWQTKDSTTEDGDYTNPEWNFRMEEQSRYIVVIKNHETGTLYQPKVFTRSNYKYEQDRGSGNYTYWMRPFYIEFLLMEYYESPDKYDISIYYSTSDSSLTLGDDQIYGKIKVEQIDIIGFPSYLYYMETNVQLPSSYVEVQPENNKIQFRYFYGTTYEWSDFIATYFTYILGRTSNWNQLQNGNLLQIKIDNIPLTVIGIRTYYSSEGSYTAYWHELEFEEDISEYGFEELDHLTINLKVPGNYESPYMYDKFIFGVDPFMFGAGTTFEEDFGFLIGDENSFVPDLYSLATGQCPEVIGNYVYLVNPQWQDGEIYRNMLVKSSDKLAGEIYYHLFEKSFTFPFSRSIQNFYLSKYKFGQLFIFSDKLIYQLEIADDGTISRSDEILISINDKYHITETRNGFYIISDNELYFLDYNFNLTPIFGINNIIEEATDVMLNYSEKDKALVITADGYNYVYLENFNFFLESTQRRVHAGIQLKKSLHLFCSADSPLFVFEEINSQNYLISFDENTLQANEYHYYVSDVIIKFNDFGDMDNPSVYYYDEHSDTPRQLVIAQKTDNTLKFSLKMMDRQYTNSSKIFISGNMSKDIYIKSIEVVINIRKGYPGA